MTDLFDWVPPSETAEMTATREAFERFHKENPQVYALFDRFTHQTIRAGHKNFSAYAIVHRIRWTTSVETTDDDFKINNNYVPFYSRLWGLKNPRHREFSRQRALKNEAA